MELGENNVQIMKRYEELVNEHYKEPVNRLFDVTTSVFKALVPDESESYVEVNLESWLLESIVDVFQKLLSLFIGFLQWTLILVGT